MRSSSKLLAALAIIGFAAGILTLYALSKTGEEQPSAAGAGDPAVEDAELSAVVEDAMPVDEESPVEDDSSSMPANDDVSVDDVPVDDVPVDDESNEAAAIFESDDAYWWIWSEAAAIRMTWTDDSGKPFGQLELGRRSIEAGGTPVIAMTNGGIYQPGLIPAGLYIESGEELLPLNRAAGEGNFHLQPNGVFVVSGSTAAVVTTPDFAKKAVADGFGPIDYAVQSGPMLVIDGQPNSLFSPDSTSTHIRNAVGVDDDGRVLLIRSRKAVSMRHLADQALQLGAVNVLYLDGSLSRLDGVRPGESLVPNIPVASMIAVVDLDRGTEG